ncbi:MAG TPA: bifunctional precorrin-2 dehydrogenase/sirohydrochlorin ferrochelatase [Nitrospirae bacterium]|nr:bifunctional precorrin-2 dehydrogenase/sirohydrochlorin ferrochelatase [Nitrospirota bacterium]
MSVYYPVFLDLTEKDCLVVGGGKVAERKILSLLKAKAKVTVISEEITRLLKRKSEKGQIKFIQKKFQIEDIRDFFVIIAATSDPETNRLISQKAPFLVNVVDNPSISNFIVPSILSKKHLTIAISTEGISPALSAQIKEDLDILYGKDLPVYLRFLKGFRQRVLKEIKDAKIRRKILTDAVSKDLLRILKKEGYERAKYIVLCHLKRLL